MAREKLEEHARVVLPMWTALRRPPFRHERRLSEDEIKKLAVSILQNGLLQPISVRPTVDGRYQLIAGERRLRACKLTGMETIPAIIYHFEDEKTAALSLLENLQREQLGPFEQARALRDLLDLWDCTQEAGARQAGYCAAHTGQQAAPLDFDAGPAGYLCRRKPDRTPCTGGASAADSRAAHERRFKRRQSAVIMCSRPRRWWSGCFLRRSKPKRRLWCGMCVFLSIPSSTP